MLKLFVVAWIACSGAVCDVHPLEKEVYKSRRDCEERARHLAKLNAGEAFECGVVLRQLM